MIKAIIIDDERLARNELKKLLMDFPEIEVVAEAANAGEGIEKIENINPDLVFLDIQMPGKTGFDMLSELDKAPHVIFTTAYDEYALKAFEVNALDYLLKPVEPKRLSDAIQKLHITEQKENRQTTENINNSLLSEHDQVFVKDGERCWFVKLSDIRLFESEGNYVRVYFDTNRPLILRSLNNLDLRLNPKTFFRASRKHIINLKWVDTIETWFNGGLMVKLKGGEQVEISRRQAVKLKDM